MTFKNIFVGGIERSGTTVLAINISRIIPSLVVPEAQFKPLLFCTQGSGRVDDLRIRDHFRFKLWGIDAPASLQLAKTASRAFEIIIDELVQSHGAIRRPYVIDHTPNNFAIAKQLHEQFDSALFVYIVRHPIATIVSLMKTDWGLPSIGRALRFWARRYSEDQEGLKYLSKMCPEKLLVVSYEQLCEDTSAFIDQLSKRVRHDDRLNDINSLAFIPHYTGTQHRNILNAPALNMTNNHPFSSAETERIMRTTNIGHFQQYWETENNRVPPDALATSLAELRDYARLLKLPVQRIALHKRRQLVGTRKVVVPRLDSFKTNI